jgi:diacylglycerol kinase family enzyme
MYLYLFDAFLGKGKYKKIIDKIETRITDLEIGGRIVKLTILESIQEIIADGLRRGIKTVIVVGNDKTFCQAASALIGSDASLGIIPVGENNKIAEILGIPPEDLACEVISARLVENIDIGKINNNFFISSVDIDGHNVVLEHRGWKIIPTSKINKIKIANLDKFFDKISHPQDGLLEISLEGNRQSFWSFKKETTIDSLLCLKKLKISSPKDKKGVPVLVDGWRILKTPLEIEVLPQQTKMIVGRKRQF